MERGKGDLNRGSSTSSATLLDRSLALISLMDFAVASSF